MVTPDFEQEYFKTTVLVNGGRLYGTLYGMEKVLAELDWITWKALSNGNVRKRF